MDELEKEVDQYLLALLGSNESVNRWWDSPNKHWNGKTPRTVWETDPDSVKNYVMQYCFGR